MTAVTESIEYIDDAVNGIECIGDGKFTVTEERLRELLENEVIKNLYDFLCGPAVIDMTDDGCGCFFLVFQNGRPSHWVGDSGVEKDMEEMIEFITDELTGEFKIILIEDRKIHHSP